MLQVMHDSPRCRHSGRHLDATKAVERLDLEMFAQCEACLFQQKRVAVVFEGVIEFADLRLLFRANQQFSGRNPRELVQQRFSILRLG